MLPPEMSMKSVCEFGPEAHTGAARAGDLLSVLAVFFASALQLKARASAERERVQANLNILACAGENGQTIQRAGAVCFAILSCKTSAVLGVLCHSERSEESAFAAITQNRPVPTVC
jgi:hypothetical protein